MQEAPKEVTIPSLNAPGIKRVQAIVEAVLLYGRDLEKILVALNTIDKQQAKATEIDNESINHLLDYLATYPNDLFHPKTSTFSTRALI